MNARLRSLVLSVCVVGCDVGGGLVHVPPLDPPTDDAGKAIFYCRDQDTVACENNIHRSCKRLGEFVQAQEDDCAAKGMVCNLDRGCIVCGPGTLRCQPCERGDADCDRQRIQRCDADGNGWTDLDRCDLAGGDECVEGACRNMCDRARDERSYVGCEFFGADLDNAAIDDLNNASSQQFAIAVANGQSVPVQVRVERNDTKVGAQAEPRRIDEVIVPPGGLEVFELPRREVDGASAMGLNDGTHTALTSNAYRVVATHPITAYQFNPLANVNVFSNDASLLLPTSALDQRYTIVAWPQTIGNSDDPSQDFDPTSSREDLRAFLTVIGAAEDTQLTITLGDKVVKVVGGGPIEEAGPGDVIDLEIGAFDVVNLETQGFNADFTGSRVESTKPVVVFVGSEASDVPIFGTYATRQCCADHLEEQLFPDDSLGMLYSLARMPSRTASLSASEFEDDPLQIAVINEPEWFRVIAVREGTTKITTTLPFPDDTFRLGQGEDVILRADQDLLLESDKPVAVLQAVASQGVTGIPRQYPGGDPALIAVPPVEQYRRDYIFLTPDKYAFDFITITAETETRILLDGEPLPDTCATDPADGIVRKPGEAKPGRVIHRCQLSFPKVTSGQGSRVLSADQHDGVHTLVADREVGLIVYGFDRFVSYAYTGGLDLDVLN